MAQEQAVTALVFDASGAKKGADEFARASQSAITNNERVVKAQEAVARASAITQKAQEQAARAIERYGAQSDQAAKAAERVAKAADTTQRAQDRLNRENERAVAASERLVVSLGNQNRFLANLERTYTPAVAAANRLSQQQDQLNRIIARGGPETERAQRLLAAMAAEQARAAQASAAASAAMARQTVTAQNMVTAHAAAGQATNRLGGIASNLGFQVQDAAVQLQGGTNALVVLAQQGSQAAGAFGPLGGVIGALIAIGASATMALGGLGSETAALDKAAKSADATTEALGRTLGNTASSADDLAKKYNKLGAEMRAVEAVALMSAQRKIMEESDDLRKSVEAQVKALENRRKEFELSQRQIDLGAKMDPKNVDKFAIMSDTFKTIDDFRKGGSIQALTVQLNKLGALGGETAEPLNSVADALVGNAQRAGELAEKTKFVEAQTRLLNGTATEADKRLINIETSAGGATKSLRTLSDILNDVNDEAKRNDLAAAWDLVNGTLKDALTPAEKFKKKVDDVHAAMALVQQNAKDLGIGLNALSPDQIYRIEEALKKQDPAWQEAKKQAEQFQQNVNRVAEAIDDIDADAPISREALTVFEEAFQ